MDAEVIDSGHNVRFAPGRGGEIKALSECLGHRDPSFTLRTYTRLMPNSEARTRAAVDRVFRNPGDTDEGPEAAQWAACPRDLYVPQNSHN